MNDTREVVPRKTYDRLLDAYKNNLAEFSKAELTFYFVKSELEGFYKRKGVADERISKLEKQNKKLKNSIHKAYNKYVAPVKKKQFEDNLTYAYNKRWENQGPKLPPKEVDSNISTDNIVESVVDTFRDRSKIGVAKYGTTLQDNDSDDFLKHLQEELMDATLYIEKLRTAKSSWVKTEEQPTISSTQLSQYLHSLYFR